MTNKNTSAASGGRRNTASCIRKRDCTKRISTVPQIIG